MDSRGVERKKNKKLNNKKGNIGILDNLLG